MKYLPLLLCCLLPLTGFSQGATTEYSLPFPEPDGLEQKVFQCNNGNTMLFNFTKDDGIDIDLFDTQHKKIRRAVLKSAMWGEGNLTNGAIRGLYNMGDSVVMFLEQTVDRERGLYRIFISPSTAMKISEQKIGAHEKYGKFLSAIAVGDMGYKRFFVKKDEQSNAYAVIAEDQTAHESAKRVEVTHYSAAHSVIGKSYWNDPEKEYKADYPLDLLVSGEESVTVLLDVRGGAPRSEGEGASQYFSVLKGNSFTHHKLDPITRSGVLSKNPVTGQIELFTLDREKTKGSTEFYSSNIIVFNPADFSIVSQTPIDGSLATSYRKEHYDVSDNYGGMPAGIFYNKDGSKTILLEQMVTETVSVGRTSGTYYLLGDIALLDMDATAKPSDGYVFRKAQQSAHGIRFLQLNTSHQDQVDFERMPGLIKSGAKPGFYSFDYINGPSDRYVIYNDHPDNFASPDLKRVGLLNGVSAANTACYRIEKGKLSRSYLFGAPDNTFDARFAYLASASYSEKTGQYAVMMLEAKGREKKARIAWISL